MRFQGFREENMKMHERKLVWVCIDSPGGRVEAQWVGTCSQRWLEKEFYTKEFRLSPLHNGHP